MPDTCLLTNSTIWPANPVLLITLGLAGVSYPRWLRWTLPLWWEVNDLTAFWIAIDDGCPPDQSFA